MALNITLKGGDLRHKILIQKQVMIQNIAGSAVDWELFADNVPAAIEPLRVTDVIHAGQTVSIATVFIRIRYLKGVSPSMRVKHESETYVIQGVLDPDKRHWQQILQCLLIGAAGSGEGC